MKITIFNIFVLAICFLIVDISEAKENDIEIPPPPGNWNKVRNLKTETKLLVKMKNGTTYECDLVQLSDDELLVKDGENEHKLPKTMVSQIMLIQPCSLTRKVKNSVIAGSVGFGLGLGLGLAISYGSRENDRFSTEEHLAVSSLIGGAFGIAAVVYTVKSCQQSETLIYRSTAFR